MGPDNSLDLTDLQSEVLDLLYILSALSQVIYHCILYKDHALIIKGDDTELSVDFPLKVIVASNMSDAIKLFQTIPTINFCAYYTRVDADTLQLIDDIGTIDVYLQDITSDLLRHRYLPRAKQPLATFPFKYRFKARIDESKSLLVTFVDKQPIKISRGGTRKPKLNFLKRKKTRISKKLNSKLRSKKRTNKKSCSKKIKA